jgi:hypothetical protein
MIAQETQNYAIQEPEIPGWFHLGELNLLYGAVRSIDAKNCLEIGTYMGRSTFALCSALKACGGQRRLLCVDPWASPIDEEYFELDFMKTMLERYPSIKEEYSDWKKYPTTLDCFGLTMNRYPFMKDFVEVRRARSSDTEFTGEVFDLAFIDGDHTYEGVKHDYHKVRPHVRQGGIICLHDDSEHFPGVQKFINEVKEMSDVRLLSGAVSARAFYVLR